MVEDALKSTRNLQRLLLLTCLVAIVFVASLEDTSQLEHQLRTLVGYRDLGSTEYADFVEGAVRDHLASEPSLLWHGGTTYPAPEVLPAAYLAAQIDATWAELAPKRGLRIAGADALAQALVPPLHIGRILPEELPFGDPDATINEILEKTRKLPSDRDIQAFFAVPVYCLSTVLSQASKSAQTIVHPPIEPDTVFTVQDVHLDWIGPAHGDVHSFVDTQPEEDWARLTFEIAFGGITMDRYAVAEGVVRLTIPDTSWNAFLNANQDYGRFLANAGVFDWNEPLGEVQSELEAAIRSSHAQNRTIDLVGVSIPGSMALLGIPALLIGIAVFLLLHLRHLQRLVDAHRQTFQEFAWTPLAPGRLWRWEVASVVFVLPALVDCFLLARAYLFGVPEAVSVVVFVLALSGSLSCGWAILRSLEMLRRRLWES